MTPSPLPSAAPAAAVLPRRISGLAAVAARYDALVCDVWGVVHDGERAHDAAVQALQRFRATRGPVLLLSNAPRPQAFVQDKLKALGVARASWDAMLTSGDMTRAYLQQASAAGRSFFHHGPARDRGLFADLPSLRLVAHEDAADEILLSGLWDDRSETPDHYTAALRAWRARKQKVICANPDRQVQIGARLVYCAGALAERYQQMGGEVVWFGKPHAPIFRRARELLRLAASARLLVIGDGAATDMAGANAMAWDALFVLGGLTQAAGQAPANGQAVRALLQAHKASARYYCERLAWASRAS